MTDKSYVLTAFRAHIPKVPKRAKLDARVGLSEEEQNRLLEVVHPNSPQNPWARKFNRIRNWLIVLILLVTGMRRGELMGLQIGDLMLARTQFWPLDKFRRFGLTTQ